MNYFQNNVYKQAVSYLSFDIKSFLNDCVNTNQNKSIFFINAIIASSLEGNNNLNKENGLRDQLAYFKDDNYLNSLLQIPEISEYKLNKKFPLFMSFMSL